MRIRPYRTLDHVIEGAVLTFVDISEMKAIKDALEKANRLSRMAVVVMDAHDAITVQDLEGRTLAWNPGAERMYGWSEAEALQMNVRERIPLARRANALTKVIRLSRAEVLEPYRTQRLTKGGAVLEVSMISTALLNESGQMYAVATTERPNDTTQSLPEPETL
jgi:two-component system CheB/CheR fusion protein